LPDAPLKIRDGIVDLKLALPPEGPTVAGGFHLADVTLGDFALKKARGRADLTDMAGTASATLEGEAGPMLPFQAQAQLSSISNGYQLDLSTTVGQLELSLAQPARILRLEKGWQLMPATVQFPKGSVEVAGVLAGKRALQVKIKD